MPVHDVAQSCGIVVRPVRFTIQYDICKTHVVPGSRTGSCSVGAGARRGSPVGANAMCPGAAAGALPSRSCSRGAGAGSARMCAASAPGTLWSESFRARLREDNVGAGFNL